MSARVSEPYVLDGPARRPWWPALVALDEALAKGDAESALAGHIGIAHGLLADGAADLSAALASAVLFGESAWVEIVSDLGRPGATGDRGAGWPAGIEKAARYDLEALAAIAGRDWQGELETRLRRPLPVLRALAHAPTGAAADAQAALAAALAGGDRDGAWAVVDRAARELGAGPLARFEAYTWEGEALRGLAEPAGAELDALVGLDRPLARLTENVEAFLGDRPALATLLYGPRGSGKSTAVRGLLGRYRDRGLRLVEVPGHRLDALPAVLDALRRRPHHHVLFLDDLAFDAGDARVRPLKSLLEGGLRAGPPRVLVVATSNRRHLVRERFSDRPDPGDDDVHAGDTQHDALALADRFGLMITFPSADQRAYLGIVSTLARRAGVALDGLDERALRFAAWGNGFSGRTARQFVDVLRREAAPAEAAGDEPEPSAP
jgi:uncharacterized protein